MPPISLSKEYAKEARSTRLLEDLDHLRELGGIFRANRTRWACPLKWDSSYATRICPMQQEREGVKECFYLGYEVGYNESSFRFCQKDAWEESLVSARSWHLLEEMPLRYGRRGEGDRKEGFLEIVLLRMNIRPTYMEGVHIKYLSQQLSIHSGNLVNASKKVIMLLFLSHFPVALLEAVGEWRQ